MLRLTFKNSSHEIPFLATSASDFLCAAIIEIGSIVKICSVKIIVKIKCFLCCVLQKRKKLMTSQTTDITKSEEIFFHYLGVASTRERLVITASAYKNAIQQSRKIQKITSMKMKLAYYKTLHFSLVNTFKEP